MISLGTYTSAVPARRTKDTRLPTIRRISARGVQVRRASGGGQDGLSAPDPLTEPVPADNTSGFQGLTGVSALRPSPASIRRERGHEARALVAF